MPDIIYNRPINRKRFISVAKHQSTANNSFSKWLNINIERDLFDYADYGNYQKLENINLSWTCQKGNMWSIYQDRSYVGNQKQQFGFFQKPVNANDEWHGFPVIPFSKSRYEISDNLLERWVSDGIINEDDVPNIMNKKKI